MWVWVWVWVWVCGCVSPQSVIHIKLSLYITQGSLTINPIISNSHSLSHAKNSLSLSLSLSLLLRFLFFFATFSLSVVFTFLTSMTVFLPSSLSLLSFGLWGTWCYSSVSFFLSFFRSFFHFFFLSFGLSFSPFPLVFF